VSLSVSGGSGVVEFSNVTKVYSGGVVALDNVSFSVAERSIHALLGHNGAGKTTSIRLILGLLKPSSGVVRVLGRDPFREPEVRLSIGYVGEYAGLYRELSVWENLLRFCAFKLGDEELCKEEVGMVADAFELHELLRKKPQELSAGNRQRVVIARAFIGKPKLVVLDEPLSNLDPVWRARVKEFLKKYVEEQGATVVFSSHILSDVEDLADDVSVLKSGRVVYTGGLKQLLGEQGVVKLVVKATDRAKLVGVLSKMGLRAHLAEDGESVAVYLKSESEAEEVLNAVSSAGVGLKYVSTERTTLEDIYLRMYGAKKNE